MVHLSQVLEEHHLPIVLLFSKEVKSIQVNCIFLKKNNDLYNLILFEKENDQKHYEQRCPSEDIYMRVL